MAKRRVKKSNKNIVAPKNVPQLLWLKDITKDQFFLVGGKNASLARMYQELKKKGVPVPNGFAVTTDVYWDLLKQKDLRKKIKDILQNLDIANVSALDSGAQQIQQLLLSTKFSESLQKKIITAYKRLAKQSGVNRLAVAVRSSATAEDLPDASFAGQQETFLNIKGEKDLLAAVKKCIASLFTPRAISYRDKYGFDHLSVGISVLVQQMINASNGVSGVMFTVDTETGFDGVVLINASYGLGEYIVKGKVTPDQFFVFKEGVKKDKAAIISRELGRKHIRLGYGSKNGTKQFKVTKEKQTQYCISDNDLKQLAQWAIKIEDFYNKPQDIEWVKDGKTGKLYIVQSRPETVTSKSKHAVVEHFRLRKRGSVLLQGIAIGQRIGAGKVRLITNPKQQKKYFKQGEVLVARITDPNWEPLMRVASAIITEEGGKTSHAAIVSREMGVPCIVGVPHATKKLKKGQAVTVSCAEGEKGFVYKGTLPFEVKKTKLTKVPKTKTKIMLNVGDPGNAFSLAALPHQGVGLAREEFIISNFIRVHPLALINFNKLKDKEAKKEIAKLTKNYKNKSDYFVDKLAQGIGMIATSAYPHNVVLRLSDLKSNEYARLIGGAEFEPIEANPMLGWRGASRYYDSEYKKAFKLECKAIKRARNEWGLKNIIVMVPFCRTPEEAKKVLKLMETFGLKRGEDGLKVYVMCEIPSNVILAKEFAKIFDGFSIGSNDLTQLSLGVDRDSSSVQHLFDETDETVKQLIRSVIKEAHKHNTPVGFCGQAPSDYPAFTDFLIKEGVDSISLNPDTIISTRKRVARVEKTLGKTGDKTNKAYLSLVGVIGFCAALLIGLGAGCSVPGTDDSVSVINSVQAFEVSPREIREKAEAKVRALMQQQVDDAESEYIDRNKLQLSFSYPARWSVEQLPDGVLLKNPVDPSENVYVVLSNGTLLEQAPGGVSSSVAGHAAITYDAVLFEDGALPQKVIKIERGEGVFIEINARSEYINAIVDSLVFLKEIISDEIVEISFGDTSDSACTDRAVYVLPSQDAESCVWYSSPCKAPSNATACIILDDE